MPVGKIFRYVPAPALLLVAALALFWVMARLDGAQSTRLAELDTQQQQAVQSTQRLAHARKATAAASEAANAEIARLRAAVVKREANLARLRRLADSLGTSVQPILAALPDTARGPVLLLLATKDSVIADQAVVVTSLQAIVDTLTTDRDRWRLQEGETAALATQWETQARRWEKEAKRGCLPVVGCLGRTTTFLVGVAVGGGGSLLLRR